MTGREYAFIGWGLIAGAVVMLGVGVVTTVLNHRRLERAKRPDYSDPNDPVWTELKARMFAEDVYGDILRLPGSNEALGSDKP